jgi:hypothetical protein
MGTVQKVDKALKGIPLNDKVAALILNLCERDRDAITAICGMVGAISYMAKKMDAVNRCGCVEVLRSASDEIERGHKLVVLRE